MDVRIEGLSKEFDRVRVLDEVSLDIRSGELVALLGPSGSGKTTLLRLIAGLENPTEGMVFFGAEDASQKTVQERNIGFVFQHYALFRHMTVLDNVAFGLKVRVSDKRPPPEEIRNRALDLLELVQLSGLEMRYPAQLSGGQRQRVALARAMAVNPTILLLDEPFGALDAQVRKELRRWLRDIHDRTGYTTVFVTHDQEEALELADRIVVLNNGSIEQTGTPDEIYDNPVSQFVYGFIGQSNCLSVTVSGGEIWLEGRSTGLPATNEHDGQADLYFRPHDIQLVMDSEHGLLGSITGSRRVAGTRHLEVKLEKSASVVELELPPDRALFPRESRIAFKPTKWMLFRGEQ
ncbi:sulfate/molybdate ABC transporter ATP-binding protein [Ensifer adhaerens]|uniref:sulfate/molybdate ABC transporter ATP-binding protein n=1 Tax=Ensifer adhaerens TaxID=106592 RepID=UPI00098F2221|nr:sulfate/molybdate ABC transporter ATP-binding protein [Ensifer adhaerens]